MNTNYHHYSSQYFCLYLFLGNVRKGWLDHGRFLSVGRHLGNKEIKGMDKWDDWGMLVIMLLGSKVIMKLRQ
jgi:hypothetical protein